MLRVNVVKSTKIMLCLKSQHRWLQRIRLSICMLHLLLAGSRLSCSFQSAPRIELNRYRVLVSNIFLYAESENRGGGNLSEEDPRLFQKRIREEQLNAILQSRSKDNDRNMQRIVQQRSKKEIIKKRRQGEAASASMDLPKEAMVTTIGGGTNALFESIRKAVVPRWHPVAGVADVNPLFRVESPAMNSNGYAASIWRNARKRQPAMWRYSLRTFDRMIQQQQQQQKGSSGPKLDIVNTHYEGALVAASKLGWSRRAIEIYDMVEAKQDLIMTRIQQSSNGNNGKSGGGIVQTRKLSTHISENMILSVIRASVREAVKQRTREPLDRVLQHVIRRITDKHGIGVTSIHLNPIASAYQTLGYTKDANNVLLGNLLDRIGGPEAENVMDTTFNVYDVQAKDKGSYSLLVQSAVQEQDWGQAALALKTMTEAGLYPSKRHLNVWTEVSGKRYKHPR